MRLCNLKYVFQILKKREDDCTYYNEKLYGLPLSYQVLCNKVKHNFSYYPVLFENESQLRKAIKELEAHRVFPRRYFFPLLSKLDYVSHNELPIAENISERILCLPLSYKLTKTEMDMICRCIKRTLRY